MEKGFGKTCAEIATFVRLESPDCLCIADNLAALFYIARKRLTDEQHIEDAVSTTQPAKGETFLDRDCEEKLYEHPQNCEVTPKTWTIFQVAEQEFYAI